MNARISTKKAIENAINAASLTLSMELKDRQQLKWYSTFFVTLPTGYEMSAIFHLLPVSAHYFELAKSPVVIAMAPLL